MKIACVSDLHGHLPEIPECDLLLMGGDICFGFGKNRLQQRSWCVEHLNPWLKSLPMKVVAVAGNHDFAFYEEKYFAKSLHWTYLQDEMYEFEGLKIWGNPWQLKFHDWAFNLEEWELSEKFGDIPNSADVLLLHGPPHLFGDANRAGTNLGSPSLTRNIERIKPKLVVCGHIHEGYGRYQLDDTIIVNGSLVDYRYDAVNEIQIIDL